MEREGGARYDCQWTRDDECTGLHTMQTRLQTLSDACRAPEGLRGQILPPEQNDDDNDGQRFLEHFSQCRDSSWDLSSAFSQLHWRKIFQQT